MLEMMVMMYNIRAAKGAKDVFKNPFLSPSVLLVKSSPGQNAHALIRPVFFPVKIKIMGVKVYWKLGVRRVKLNRQVHVRATFWP